MKRRGDGDNAISLVLPNGTRIVGLPGTEGTVRGFSAVSLLLIDEAARVQDAMYKALRPMLAVGDGDLWLMSTPYGKRGFFYEAGSTAARSGSGYGAGDGVSADPGGVSGGGAAGDGAALVRAGVYVRVRG